MQGSKQQPTLNNGSHGNSKVCSLPRLFKRCSVMGPVAAFHSSSSRHTLVQQAQPEFRHETASF